MKVLVACEESGRVTSELLALGVDAYSCDLLPTSGDHPERHIQGDVTPLLSPHWDLIIAFPPCTFLTVTGNRWFNIDKYGDKARQRTKTAKMRSKTFPGIAKAMATQWVEYLKKEGIR